MMLYRWKVHMLKTERGSRAWAGWRTRRGSDVGNYHRLPEYIRQYTAGKSFADIGCMWGVNGAYSFLAEEVGATSVKAVDVFGPTPEFEQEMAERGSQVDFILGDATDPGTIERIGLADVVLCAGVLYHHPSPFDVLVALRMMCRQTLILRTSTIPENKSLPNAAVFYPMLTSKARRAWRIPAVQGRLGIDTEFLPDEGYGNWFWGFTPSCLKAMVTTAGFRVARSFPEPFAHTLICEPIDMPFRHTLPDQTRAREIGDEVSRSGMASPA